MNAQILIRRKKSSGRIHSSHSDKFSVKYWFPLKMFALTFISFYHDSSNGTIKKSAKNFGFNPCHARTNNKLLGHMLIFNVNKPTKVMSLLNNVQEDERNR